jgi:hypothetical protein
MSTPTFTGTFEGSFPGLFVREPFQALIASTSAAEALSVQQTSPDGAEGVILAFYSTAHAGTNSYDLVVEGYDDEAAVYHHIVTKGYSGATEKSELWIPFGPLAGKGEPLFYHWRLKFLNSEPGITFNANLQYV